MLGEVQVADAAGVSFPDRHGGKERRAAVPQPQQLVVPQRLQQGAEACVVLLVQVVVVAVRVEVESPESIGAKICPQLDGPLHEYSGTFLKPPSCQLLHLLLRHVDVGPGSQLPGLLPINVLFVPVPVPLRPPEFPVDDSQTAKVLSWYEVDDVPVGLPQVRVQAAVLRQATMHRGPLLGVVGVVAESVGVEDGDVLTRPVSTWASVDVEEMVEVGGDIVLDGAHVQWSVPGGDEGLPGNQGQLGRFLTEGRLEEQRQPAAGEDDMGGGCPTHRHHRHAGVQEEQLSIILRVSDRDRKTESFLAFMTCHYCF